MRTAVALLAHACVLTVVGCTGSSSSSTDRPGSGAGSGAGPGSDEAGSEEIGTIEERELVGRELPVELVAELRMQGADSDGRLLTLAPGFIATAACSDCGAPSYLWFMAVRCSDPQHCEVLTEQCEGEVSRDAGTYRLEFRAVEAADVEVCAGYTGTFEIP